MRDAVSAIGLAPHNFLLSWIAIGLACGSFVTVLVARIPERRGIQGRSQCISCKAMIQVRDNIPVLSYLLLKGKCRFCKAPISIRYPLTELAALLLVVVAVESFEGWWKVLAWVVFSVLGLALAIIDLQTHRLPNVLTAWLFGLVAALLLGDILANHHADRIKMAVISSVALTFFYFLLNIISRGGMGMGDVKLAASIGLILGYINGSSVIVGTFCGFFFGSTISVMLMATGRATRKSQIPFGPFMLLGAFVAPWLTPHLVSIFL
jgi:leader peptidase (prepilin peptidase) / N-methyltransferase